MTVGSLSPAAGPVADAVEFSSDLAPDELESAFRDEYAEHRGGGATRLERLGPRPAEHRVSFTLVPIEGAPAPLERLARLHALRGRVCSLVVGARVVGDVVVASVRERHRDAAGTRVSVDVELTEYS